MSFCVEGGAALPGGTPKTWDERQRAACGPRRMVLQAWGSGGRRVRESCGIDPERRRSSVYRRVRSGADERHAARGHGNGADERAAAGQVRASGRGLGGDRPAAATGGEHRGRHAATCPAADIEGPRPADTVTDGVRALDTEEPADVRTTRHRVLPGRRTAPSVGPSRLQQLGPVYQMGHLRHRRRPARGVRAPGRRRKAETPRHPDEGPGCRAGSIPCGDSRVALRAQCRGGDRLPP